MTERNHTSALISSPSSSSLPSATRRQWLAGTAASALALASGNLLAQTGSGTGTGTGQRVLRVHLKDEKSGIQALTRALEAATQA